MSENKKSEGTKIVGAVTANIEGVKILSRTGSTKPLHVQQKGVEIKTSKGGQPK